MIKMNKQILIDAGIDYDSGVRRFMGDAGLYEEILAEFLQDNCFDELTAAYEQKDYNQVFIKSHSLKGLTGNLDMTNLYQEMSKLTESVRNAPAIESEVQTLYARVAAEYARVTDGLRAAMK